MVDESPVTTNTPPPTTAPQSRTFSVDESAGVQSHFLSEIIPDGHRPDTRRRSSNLSEYSLKNVRNAFQSITDEILFPRPSDIGYESSQASSHWHSAPLAFALLPALVGTLFTNGSGFATDVMLLGLAAIFLNWSVRLPWDWYHAAQAAHAAKTTRESDEYIHKAERYNDKVNEDTVIHEEPENAELSVEDSLDPKSIGYTSLQTAAASELSRNESLALFSCFLFPLIGAYLLHSLRSQLKRPSEGLISNYNLTIFLLASELRPVAHVAKLIQTRTLRLQKVVTSKSYENEIITEFTKEISERLEKLEAQCISNGKTNLGTRLSDKLSNTVVIEVRRNLQPDIDALNRAVRRYEKRATAQAFQTDSRIQELESRLNNYVSLAAAAVNNEYQRHLSLIDILEWATKIAVQPFRILNFLVNLPLSLMKASFEAADIWTTARQTPVEKPRKATTGKPSTKASPRSRDLSQGMGSKRA